MVRHIQTRGFSLTTSLKEAVQESLFDALGNYPFIRMLDVRLEDINGKNHGGIDKRCQVVIKVTDAPNIVVRSTQSDMYVAIRHCASKAKRVLRRHVNKRTRIAA